MKKAQQIYSKTFTFQTPCTFHANPSDEIPTFEEAFDTVSLRKFFQDRESTNSQSACSPRKDTLMLEEIHSQAATDQRDSLLSPMPYSVNRSKSDTVLTDSRFNLRFNFNLNTPLFTNKTPTTSSKKCQPFTIVRAQRTNSTPSFGNSQSILPRNSPDYLSMFEPITVPFKKQDLYPTYQPSFPQFFQPIENDLISLMKTESMDKLIKKKKVFTIERNVKPGRKSLNRKREASFKHQESSPPISKHVKTNRVSSEAKPESEVDTFDSFFPDLSEYLKSFEGANSFDL